MHRIQIHNTRRYQCCFVYILIHKKWPIYEKNTHFAQFQFRIRPGQKVLDQHEVKNWIRENIKAGSKSAMSAICTVQHLIIFIANCFFYSQNVEGKYALKRFGRPRGERRTWSSWSCLTKNIDIVTDFWNFYKLTALRIRHHRIHMFWASRIRIRIH
jgi:hypothetical protein